MAIKDFIDRKDLVLVVALTLTFFVVGIWNIGLTTAPQTSWAPLSSGEGFYIDFGEESDIEEIYILETDATDVNLTIFGGSPNNWQKLTTFGKKGYYFNWDRIHVNTKTRYLKFEATIPNGRISEIVIGGKDGKINLSSNNIFYDGADESNGRGVSNLLDEQDKFDYPPSYKSSTYFDEIYFVRTANEFILHEQPFEWTHPPLGKLIMMGGILTFGFNPFGWRIMGLLIGAAMIPLMYIFGKRLFGSRIGAFTSAFLMTFDGMHFVLSRIGMVDIFLVFFIVLMFYFFFNYYEGDLFKEGKNAKKSLFLSGIFFGLALSVKWTALYSFAGVCLLFAFIKLWEFINYTNVENMRELPRKIKNISETDFLKRYFFPHMDMILLSVGISVLLYFVWYTPFYLVPGPGHGLVDALKYQGYMYSYHSNLNATHPFSSVWWSWPLILKPVWLYVGHKTPSTIALMGNPAIWWISIPCLFFVGWSAIKKNKIAIFIIVAFLMQYVPYVLIPRILFIYHFFPNVPFMCLGIAFCANKLWDKKWGKAVVIAYLVFVIALFIYFYPILSGYPTTSEFIDQAKWLEDWIF